jgi:type I restriction enzyme S subunit
MALRVGSGLPNIQKKGLSKLKLSVQSRLEQLQIIELLNSLENTVSNLDRQINQTQTWKKGLLQQMFV